MTSTPAAALFGTMTSSPMAGGADGAVAANAAKGQGVPGVFAAVLGGQMTGDASGVPMPPPGGLPLAGAEGGAGKGEGGKGNPAMANGLGVSALLAADAMPQTAVPVLAPKFGQAATETATAGTTDAGATDMAVLAEGQPDETGIPANHGMEMAEQHVPDGLPVTAGPKAGTAPVSPTAIPGSAAETEAMAAAEAAQGKANAKGVGKGQEMKASRAAEAGKAHAALDEAASDEGESADASANVDAAAQLAQADLQASPLSAAEVSPSAQPQRSETADAPKGQDVKMAVDASKQSGAALPTDLASQQWAKEDKGVDGTAVSTAAVAEARGDAVAGQNAGHGRAEGSDFSALITGQGETRQSASAQPADKAAATTAPHPTISAQPGRIGRELGVEIARYMQDGTDQLTVRLDPGHHGQIEVTMKFDDNGQLRATVTASQSATLEMLRRDSGDLMRSLSDAGVSTDAQSFQFDSRGQGSQQGQQQRASGLGRGGNGLNDLGASVAQNDEPHYRPLVGGGRVNMVA